MGTEIRREFYDQYAKLMRIRIDYYHCKNNGVEAFLNNLLIQPYNISDGSYHDIADIRNAIEKFESETRIQHFETSLMAVEIMKGMKVQYDFSLWLQVPEDLSDENIHLQFVSIDGGYEMIEESRSDQIFEQLPDSYWKNNIRIVKDEISFGTLKLLD